MKNNRTLLSLIFTTAIMFFVTYFTVIYFQNIGGDYPVHTNSAEIIINSGLTTLLKQNQYPLWHIGVAALTGLFNVPILISTAFVTGLLNAVCFIGVYIYLKRDNESISVLVPFLAMLIMLVGPLWMPWWSQTNLYWTPNPWHNPTSFAVRPFAVFAFIYIIDILKDYEKNSKFELHKFIILAIIMVFANIAKPSFTQVIIPGLGIYLIYLLFKTKGKAISLFWRVVVTFVPCIIVTVLQFVLQFYGEGSEDGGVMFSWMLVLKNSLGNVFKLAILNLFPIFIFITNYKSFKRTDVKLVIFTWVSSFFEVALLAEKGSRKFDGNFGWGFAIAEFLAYVVSFKVLIEYTMNRNRDNKGQLVLTILSWSLFVIQLTIGIHYLISIILPMLSTVNYF